MDEKERITFNQLEEALNSRGWNNWTIIAFNENIQEYKIFSHMDNEKSLLFFKDILKNMLNVLEEREKINNSYECKTC